MKRTFDIAVVGAGPVGSAAALTLAGKGYSVALIDAGSPRPPVAPDEPHDLRVFAVSGGSRFLLETLGAWADIKAVRACPYRHMSVWDAYGRIDFDAADVAAASLGHIVENRVLQAALHARVHETGGITWFAPDRLERLTLAPAGAVLGLAEAGRLKARLVVAADGGRSPTRELAGIEVRPVEHHQMALVAHVRTEHPHGETARQRFLETGPLALLPLSDGRCSIVWSTTPAEAERLKALPVADFGRELTLASEAVLGAVEPDTEIAGFPLRSQQAETYLGERLVMVGDAAHTVHPLAGLGMNLGLRDVAELERVLGRAAERGHDPGERAVLRRYERARKPDNEVMLCLLDGFNRLFRSELPGLDLTRGWGMRLLDHSGPLKREIIRRAMN